jgi:hypothetical protein
MTRDEFFTWCSRRKLSENTPISAVFCVSSQTIRNWRKRGDGEAMPAWVPLACDGYDALTDGDGGLPILPKVTVSWLSDWQKRHSLETYEDTAGVFDLTRQAVHNWFKRGRFPRWLAIACAGHDARIHFKGPTRALDGEIAA